MKGGKKGLGSLTKWAVISSGLLLFFALIILPITSLFRFAFMDGPDDFLKAVTTEEAVNAFKNSLFLAGCSTAVNLLTGTLLAFTITRYKFPGSSVLKALMDLPLAIPAAVVGLALMMLYGPNSFFGGLLHDNGLELVGKFPGVLLAHIFVTFPFMVRSVSVVVEKLDPEMEEAAKMLGANGWSIFLRVVLPSIRSGMVAGSALTFTRSLGEFGATLFVATGFLSTAPIYIYNLTDSSYDFQAASSVALVLMIIPFFILLILNYVVTKLEVYG